MLALLDNSYIFELETFDFLVCKLVELSGVHFLSNVWLNRVSLADHLQTFIVPIFNDNARISNHPWLNLLLRMLIKNLNYIWDFVILLSILGRSCSLLCNLALLIQDIVHVFVLLSLWWSWWLALCLDDHVLSFSCTSASFVLADRCWIYFILLCDSPLDVISQLNLIYLLSYLLHRHDIVRQLLWEYHSCPNLAQWCSSRPFVLAFWSFIGFQEVAIRIRVFHLL